MQTTITLILTSALIAPPLSAAHNPSGYARTASIDGTVLDAAHSFNPHGTPIRLSRQSAGHYSIQYTGGRIPNSVSMVAAVGPGAHYCKIAGASNTIDTYDARIRCFDPAGNPSDTRYTHTLLRPDNPQRIAFAWFDGASLHPDHSWSPNGPITISTLGTGSYRVNFPGMTAPDHVQVTAQGDNNAYCSPYRWFSFVEVRCVDARNQPVHSAFIAAYASAAGQLDLGFAHQDEILLTESTHSPRLRYNSNNGAVTVTRTAYGAYSVRFKNINPAPQPAATGPTALVSGHGDESPNLRCGIDTIHSEDTDITVNLSCFGVNGESSNGLFSVTLLPPAQIRNPIAYTQSANRTGTATDSAFSFNPHGGEIETLRNGIGDYSLQYTGGPHPDAIDMAAAVGSEAHSCKTGASETGDHTYNARVLCFDANGRPIDTRFSHTLLRPYNPQHIAYARFDGTALDAGHSWSPYGPITATTIGTGTYRIGFPTAAVPDHVQVIAYGSDNTSCSPVHGTSAVEVRCVDASNQPTNSAFHIAYVRAMGQPRLGFASSQAPAAYNSTGGRVDITRITAASYQVKFASISPRGADGTKLNAIVTGGSIESLATSGADVYVNVSAPNGLFDVTLLMPQP
ncbi:MAG: hypothetical protein JNK87_41235 [Bryobacterales bacterium]|nr:hypothetical protein [Bryobacterales bacterium]